MENEVEEEKKPKNNNLISTTPDWLDLPNPIATNIILEHLDIDDHIRFSAVCKKWQSIQKEHQIRHSPHPPPSHLPFPWLSCLLCFHDYDGDMAIHFYLPDKQKAYNIPLDIIPKKVYQIGYGYGWLLLQLKFDEIYHPMCIFNPITGFQMELPPLELSFRVAHFSSPPTNPNCTIVIFDYDYNVYLYRLYSNSLIQTKYSTKDDDCAFFFRNKLYYLVGYEKICMVDALLPDPVEHMIEMDCSEICEDLRWKVFNLMDLLGELVMVIGVSDEFLGINYDFIKEFIVYRADFSKNKWTKMESLGDHALFFSNHSMFSLPAIDVGCKKNTVYLPGGFNFRGVAWRAFELSTKNWSDGPRMSRRSKKYHSYCSCSSDCHSCCSWDWFLPTLGYYNIAKPKGTC